MIEKIVYDYLNSVLDVPVVMEEEPDSPETFVRVEKTGGGKHEYIYTATFAIQSYAGSLFGAAELNEKVKEAMDDIVKLEDVCKSELNTDYNYTDTATKRYRYQAVYDLVHY